MTAIQTDIFIREPESEYRAKAQMNLSSHALADYRKCPDYYRKKHIDRLIPDVDRPAYFLGRAAHVRILEGEVRMHQEYAVGGPVNPKTGKPYGANTKAFREWSEKIGKPVLSQDQFDLIQKMSAGVNANDNAKRLIYHGMPEAVVRTKYCGMPSQSRIDFFNPEYGIVDLKTCDDLTWFESDAKRYGYAYQMAFYRAMVRLLTGNTVPVYFIAIEKKEPFRCGVWRVSDTLLDHRQSENEAAIGRLKRSIETGVWPTGFEEICMFDSF